MAYDWEGVRTRRMRLLKIGIIVAAAASMVIFASIPTLVFSKARDHSVEVSHWD